MVALRTFLRWLFGSILIGTAVLFALGVAFVALVSVPHPSDDPIFFKGDGLRVLSCYGGSPESVPEPLSIEFQNQGRLAIIRSDQKEVRLPFSGNKWFAALYADEKTELLIDPEIYITGFTQEAIGACEFK